MTFVNAARFAVVVTAATALSALLAGCGQGQQQSGGPPPPTVTVANPIQRTVVDQDEYVGRFVAIDTVVNAAPDGYSLILAGPPVVINPSLYKNLRFDFLRDIVPVASFLRQPFIMVVNPSLPAKTVPEFIAYAKANPGKLDLASPGNGTPITNG